jgi:hypothetical protein
LEEGDKQFKGIESLDTAGIPNWCTHCEHCRPKLFLLGEQSFIKPSERGLDV